MRAILCSLAIFTKCGGALKISYKRGWRMSYSIFKPPIGDPILNPEMDSLRDIILESTGDYWSQGSCGASIVWSDGEAESEMLILYHQVHGYYLQHHDVGVWLSLGDKSLLSKVVEAAGEWYASVGLFVMREEAWLAVEEFCRTGRRTSEINWVSAEEVPENGNW